MSSNNRDRLDAGASASARAAPAVRSLAKKLGVDLEKCIGTGRDGTITMNDVIARTNQAKAGRGDKAPARPTQSQNQAPNPLTGQPTSQPSRRANPEPPREVSAPPPPPVAAAPVARPVPRPISRPTPNQPAPNQSGGWMSEVQAQNNQPAAPVPRQPAPQYSEPARAQPPAQTPVTARAWATMEEDLPPEQPEPRIVATRLQDLSSYDFPSAERQPTAPQNENDPYAPRMSWFATEETATNFSGNAESSTFSGNAESSNFNADAESSNFSSDAESSNFNAETDSSDFSANTEASSYQASVQPTPPPAPLQMLNPWGAVEEQEPEQSAEPAEYDAGYAADETAVVATEDAQAEDYAEVTDDESAMAAAPTQIPEQVIGADWEAPLAEEEGLAEEALADDLTQYEPEAEPETASQPAAAADLATEEDWTKPVPPAPETPAEWAQPELAAYANTASTESRAVPLRTPYLDMTPRTLIDQEDRLHGLRRNMALNMTRARDEVATCTMFDDADLNAWPNFTNITVRLLRAIVAGIRVEPGFNATFDPAGPSRRLLRQINVAVSVDTREGLTVPVLRDIGSRSMEDLHEYVYHMKERTLTRSLSPEDLRDFSFSLANYGIFAGRYATPPVVPPTVAALGCGRLERAVVAGESVPEIHAMLPLSLTFDHRCVTMGEACRFLAALKQDLELPQ